MQSLLRAIHNHVHRIWNQSIDLIFPESDTTKKVRHLTEDTLDHLPNASQCEVENAYALWDYKNSLVREIIWQIKYYENEDLANLVAPVLYTKLLEIQSSHPANFFLIIPIPISRERKSERGFNQTELIAETILKNIKHKSSFTYTPHLLIKTRDTKHQTGESKHERLRNLNNSFTITDRFKIKGKHIILIDDVITTGATFNEIKKELISEGALSVTGLMLAH